MSNNWWADKLGAPRPVTTPPLAPPSQVPMQQMPVASPPQQPQQNYQQNYQQPAPRMPASAVNAQRCPGCGSGNYGSPGAEAKARCYDCGYPIQQSGSGVGTGILQQGGGGAPTPAKQVQTGGFSWAIGEKLG